MDAIASLISNTVINALQPTVWVLISTLSLTSKNEVLSGELGGYFFLSYQRMDCKSRNVREIFQQRSSLRGVLSWAYMVRATDMRLDA